MKIRVIFNPAADHGRAATRAPALRDCLVGLGTAEWVETGRPDAAIELAAEAAARGYDLVVAAGGDGTVNEVVNGLMRAGEGPTSRPALGVLPLGSGNDFCFGLGLPADPSAACARLVVGRMRQVDIGRVVDKHGRARFFALCAGIGFDAAVAIECRKITLVHGLLMYLVATLRTISAYYQAPNMRITFDDGMTIEQPVLMLTIGNSHRIAGGFFPTPNALIDDGLFDVCYADQVTRLRILRLIPEFMKGTHLRFPEIHLTHARALEVQADRALPVHLDGEIYAHYGDDVRQLQVRLIRATLNVLA